MLLTTCPNCGAKFKVSPEQLNVRQGRVMCGRCRNVFNAFEALKRIQDTDAGDPIDYSIVDSRRTDTGAETEPTAEPAEELLVAPAEPMVQPTMAEQEAKDAFDSYEEALKKLEQAEAADMQHDVAAVQTAEAAQTAAPDPLDQPPQEAKVDDAPPAESSVPVELPAYVAASDNPLISGAVPRQSSPSRAWGWLAAIATIFFAGQALYYFRSGIVQQYPQLRPQFVAACEVIGCRVSWGRAQDVIKIESSDLIEPPGRPGRILLTATLVNRGATKQDYPALEVKLTDASNTVLSSRILMPAEYLGRATSPDEGLAPNVELYVNLNLELVGKSPASGYGLRTFYPE